jgi:exonuclease SbcD
VPALTLLHTSDWHIGKTIRGHSRADEHTRTLAEVAEIANTHAVDLVLVAGDLFETAAPSPESEAIAWRALLDLADAAGDVVVIAGNHDNPRRLEGLRDVMRLGNIHVVAEPRRPDDGGLIGFDINGCRVDVAALPFVSKRGIVRIDELMRDNAYEHAGTYADRVRSLIDTLGSSSKADIKIIMAHAFVLGGGAVGGERAAHLADEYALPAQSFPSSCAYVALGHLHKAQKVPGPSPIHYSGSLLQLDFGDTDATKSVSLVELDPGSPAAVTRVPLSEGRALRTVVGTLDELRTRDVGDDWLRVRVREARRVDLAEQVRMLFGERCVDVLVDAPESEVDELPPSRSGRTPRELYEDYLADLRISDARLVDLFDELHADVTSGSD